MKLRSPRSICDMTKEELMKWHDLYFDKSIYIKPNHCERQILRNCVHKSLGKHVFDCAFKTKQTTLEDKHSNNIVGVSDGKRI